MIELGTRRELFVDHFLISEMNGTSLRLHNPVRENVAITFDKPWEGSFCGYSTVIVDGDRILLYYRGWPTPEHDAPCGYCLAESHDGGITFERKNLGLKSFNGSTDNNLFLLNEPAKHNFSPFLDTRPGVPEDQRFKALGSKKGDTTGLVAYVSADGESWRLLQEEMVITKGAFDSQNVCFWSESEGCYLSYYRTWDQGRDATEFRGKRTVSRATSDDFIHWTDPEQVSYGDTPREELYTSQTHPYPRAPHIYLAFAKRFTQGRRVMTDAEVAATEMIPRYAEEISDCVLMTTRGFGATFQRTFMEALVRPGPERENWCSRTNMAAMGTVQTGERELSMYLHNRYAQPAQYLRRYSLRLDGFISLNGPYAGGEMITKPFTFSGSELELNLDTSGPGGIQIELLEAGGAPIPGFRLEDVADMYGDEIAAVARWNDSSDVSSLSGKAIRMRLVMHDADLYSFRFKE